MNRFHIDKFASPTLRMLAGRGFVADHTDTTSLDDMMSSGPVSFYAGFDATADSLHVGHLLPIMAMRMLQRMGHRPIVVIGTGTTRIGDPSFRSEARPMLDDEAIARNAAGVRACLERFLVFGDGPTDAVMVDNSEWLAGMNWLDMLRDVGRHVSVSRMLSFDGVKTRLDRQEGMSFLEFNYSILQSIDFLELARRFDCRLQIGGTDQWGNIVSGIDLARRTEGRSLHGLTVPLLATSSGAKMGKTAAGAVWLHPDRLGTFDYRQFWRNTEDADVGRFLRLFTDLSDDAIEGLDLSTTEGINGAKDLLANEATRLAHGEVAASEASGVARSVFSDDASCEGLPRIPLPTAAGPLPLIDVLLLAGFASSRSDARRTIAGRGIRIAGTIVEDVETRIDPAALQEAPLRLSLGRKKHAALVSG
jgi:tyrosyl-tRNA synthetase